MSAARERIDQAREFLDGARRHKVTELPPSVLTRELAEARRQLGQLLDVIAQGAVLDDGQREAIGQALADAIQFRDRGGRCPRCEASPAGLCDDHAEDLDKTGAYLALARELGIEVPR